jgi:ligand-binding SRPBCC domain-containing protein
MRHCMLNVILVNWPVVVRDVGNRHFTDEMLKGPMAAFRHEHQVEVGGAVRCTPTGRLKQRD